MEPTITSHEAFERIKEEHHALRQQLREIHEALATSQTDQGRIPALLQGFREALVSHFQNEEVEGFFDEVTNRSPRLSHRVDTLCVEHQQLLNDANELCQMSECATQSRSKLELTYRWHEFSKCLMHHESQENELLQETNLSDIGTSD